MEPQNRMPNILWICTDQQRFDTLGCYGNKYVHTPNIDKLAQKGVLFENCYCQSPVCTPSRASFLTGRYPRTTRCRQNGQCIPCDEVLITKILADNGYTCGLSGKLHISACDDEWIYGTEPRIEDGYQEFHWSHHPDDHWITNEYIHWLREKGLEYERIPYSGSKYVYNSMPEELHHTTWCVQKAVNFIKAGAKHNKPWLFSVNLYDPHHYFDPPKEFLDRYLSILNDFPLPEYREGELDNKPVFQKDDHMGSSNWQGNFAYSGMNDEDHRLICAAYWAMVDLIDKQVGRLIETLEKTGQLDDTIIIFTSDHGEMLGDHGIYLKGPFFYEQAVRIPLIISYSDKICFDQRSKALIELVDIAPTLLEAVGLDIYPGMQGKSLWNLLTGNADLNTHKKEIYCEYYNALTHHKNPAAYATMIRNSRYKLVTVHGLDQGELYDLEEDPGEFENKWEDKEYLKIKSSMQKQMCDSMAWTIDPLPIRVARY